MPSPGPALVIGKDIQPSAVEAMMVANRDTLIDEINGTLGGELLLTWAQRELDRRMRMVEKLNKRLPPELQRSWAPRPTPDPALLQLTSERDALMASYAVWVQEPYSEEQWARLEQIQDRLRPINELLPSQLRGILYNPQDIVRKRDAAISELEEISRLDPNLRSHEVRYWELLQLVRKGNEKLPLEQRRDPYLN